MKHLTSKLINLKSETLENIKNAKSANTIRAYKADIRDFIKFCNEYKLNSIPADIKIISLYITYLSKKNKFSTIKRRLASIKVNYNLRNEYVDLKHPLINENLKSIKKKIGIYQKSKKPISIEGLKSIVIEIDKEKKIKEKLRNRSIILMGFSGAFRRSELVSILKEDIEFVKEGVKIFLRRSKTDQSGEGMIKAIPYFSNIQFCPVNSLKLWLDYSKKNIPTEKKLFNISDKSVALIIKKYISKIGLISENYSGHSLRSGFATSAAQAGAEERSIMSMTGHKSTTMLRRYIHESNLFNNNALSKMNI